MYKNTRKGFTLIELLAVILILGIIALIVIPTVNKILEESRMGAFESTINNIDKKVKETCTMEQIKDIPINSQYIISDGKITPELDIKGDLPDGEILVDNNCNVTYTLANKNFVANKDNPEEKPIIDKCKGTCIKYKELILNGTDPIMDSGMIPVTIDNNGTVKKANLYSEWYNYQNKKWANVVLVKDNVRDNYKKAEAGTTITSADILAYLVWIPRYKYKIPTSGTSTPSTIDIVFENKGTSKTVGDGKTTYYSHPAFTFGGVELNGIWVGKFETTGDTTTPTILPNVTSLRNINNKTMFDTSRKFTNDTYGVTSDAHMMKSSEWGAAAYLSHSNYGINTEVRINNNNGYITGCGANNANGATTGSCEIRYGSNISSYPQSTTGNITGIFDMSGGAWDSVMGNYNNITASSGFSEGLTEIGSKYYDYFNSTTSSNACSGVCFGHTLSEAASWYSDYADFLDSGYPWLIRGGSYIDGADAGVLCSYYSLGVAYSNGSFRLLVSPGA